ncbi:MAG: hypothetical protein ACQ9MH_21455 [Nitrospinales bacterium]
MCGYPQNIGVGSMLIALTIAFFPHATAAEFTVDSGVTTVRSLRGNAGVRIEAQLEDPGGIEVQPLENAVRIALGDC